MYRIRKSITPKHPGSIEVTEVMATANNLRQLAFDNSMQANIITTNIKGNIIMANKAAGKLLGYSKKELLTKKRSAIFDIKENSFKKMLKEREAEGHSIAMVTVITKKGMLIPCEVRSAVFMDEDGIKKSIITISDMRQSILNQKNIDTKKEKIVSDNIVLAKTKQKNIDVKKEKIVAHNIIIAIAKQKQRDIKKEKVVADNIIQAQARSDKEKLDQETLIRKKLVNEYEENFRAIFNSSSDILFDVDLLSDELFLNDAYEEEFGYKITGNRTSVDEWLSHIHPGDKTLVIRNYRRMLASRDFEWKSKFRFLRADKSVASITTRSVILREPGGKAFRQIGFMQDISKQTVLEERLEQEIKLKEKQIAEALEDAKDSERSDIGKELHDNVNQLLSASKMYLDMAKRGGAQSEMYLSRSSEYTLTAIEEIRKLTRGLTSDIIKNLGLTEAIETITHDTMQLNPIKITYSLDSFKESAVKDKFKLNIFRIVQEQLNNILKHSQATKASISLSQNKESILLNIADDGIGFDISKKRIGIGVDNIKSRAITYHGNADFVSKPGKGCVLNITFPLSEALLN
ncbi:MAG: PAS domain S-box protein [Ferruginibacter sp.]